MIDSAGCSTEEYLMPELTYSSDRTRAVVAASAFKFPDRTSVYFNCQIKLCYKTNDDCSTLTPPKCGIEAVEDKSLENELNNDQLISSTTDKTPTPSSLLPSSISSQTTTTAPSTTTASRTPITSRSTRLSSSSVTTTAPITTTTTASTTTSTTTAASSPSTEAFTSTQPVSPSSTVSDVTTRVFLSSTESLSESTIAEKFVNDFPTPTTLRKFIEDKYKNSEVSSTPKEEEEVEGSGLEIMQQPRAEALRKGETSEAERREIKRREADSGHVDIDISSPEMTIVDKDYELPEALAQKENTRKTSSSSQPASANSVCVSLAVFWALMALFVLCLFVFAFAFFHAQRRQHTFSKF